MRLKLSGKHRTTVAAVFADPARSNVAWEDVEAMLNAFGASIEEGRGSRVRIEPNGHRAVFHRPHPAKETDKGALKSVRRFSDRGLSSAMTMMRHEGYEASVEYDDEAGLFHGEITNLRDVITFQGHSVDELKEAFAESVRDYLEFCKSRGEEPEQPASGELSVKVGPALHRAVLSAARRSGVTPDEWVSRALLRAAA